MQKISTALLLCFVLTCSFGQTQRKVSTNLLLQYTNTIYDQTLGNNPWGIGLAVETFFNTHTKFKPAVEFSGSIYLEDDKVLRVKNGKELERADGFVNLFGGASYHPSESVYLSFLLGPAFMNGETLLGIKPSLGFYFAKNKKWIGKVSYINIFKRGNANKENFSSVSFAVGLKLF